jgi:hypothetical protein
MLELEELALQSGGDHGHAALLRLGAERSDRAALEKYLPGADVLFDQRGYCLCLELRAVRTLDVDVFDHRHGRIRIAELVPLLGDVVVQLVDLGGVRERLGGRRRA